MRQLYSPEQGLVDSYSSDDRRRYDGEADDYECDKAKPFRGNVVGACKSSTLRRNHVERNIRTHPNGSRRHVTFEISVTSQTASSFSLKRFKIHFAVAIVSIMQKNLTHEIVDNRLMQFDCLLYSSLSIKLDRFT